MELKMILTMLAITVTSSLANPFQSHINNRAICDGLPNGFDFCTDDCTRHVQCVSGLSITIQDCSASGTHCYKFSDGSAPVCSTVSQCGGPIQCYQAGEFPDPDDCTKYHVCSSPSGSSTVHDCIGTSYNIATNACDQPVNNPDVCGPDGPVPECTVKGQVGALTQNLEYYFVCLQTGSVLYPGLWKCRDGYFYNPDDKICKSLLTTTPGTTTSGTTTSGTTTSGTTTSGTTTSGTTTSGTTTSGTTASGTTTSGTTTSGTTTSGTTTSGTTTSGTTTSGTTTSAATTGTATTSTTVASTTTLTTGTSTATTGTQPTSSTSVPPTTVAPPVTVCPCKPGLVQMDVDPAVRKILIAAVNRLHSVVVFE